MMPSASGPVAVLWFHKADTEPAAKEDNMNNDKQMTAAFFAAAVRTFKIRVVQAVNDGEPKPWAVAFNFVRDGLVSEYGLGIKPAAMVAHTCVELIAREHGRSGHTDADLLDGFRAAIA
jgi:hypothetical protein